MWQRRKPKSDVISHYFEQVCAAENYEHISYLKCIETRIQLPIVPLLLIQLQDICDCNINFELDSKCYWNKLSKLPQNRQVPVGPNVQSPLLLYQSTCRRQISTVNTIYRKIPLLLRLTAEYNQRPSKKITSHKVRQACLFSHIHFPQICLTIFLF